MGMVFDNAFDDKGNFRGGEGGSSNFNPRGVLSMGDLLCVWKPGIVERQENFGSSGGV